MFNKKGIRKMLRGLSVNLATASIIGIWIRHAINGELTGCYALLLISIIAALLATIEEDYS